jgi:acetyl esterase/lipase
MSQGQDQGQDLGLEDQANAPDDLSVAEMGEPDLASQQDMSAQDMSVDDDGGDHDQGAMMPERCGRPAPTTELTLRANTDDFPESLLATQATFYKDIPYGSDGRLKIDLFIANSQTPSALVIFIHGGGFLGGSHTSIYRNTPEIVASYLNEGVSFATVSYRVLEDGDREGVRKSLHDVRYALQFIRYHASSFGIGPERIALRGGSAGAGSALWVGLSDEACDPLDSDPVRAMSTRVSAIAALNTPSTYDIVRWETDVFGPTFPAVTLAQVASLDSGALARMAQFYGLDPETMTLEQLQAPDVAAYRAEVDMFALVDAHDPPVFLANPGPTTSPTTMGQLLHHPLHAEVLYKRLSAVGVEAQLRTRDRQQGPAMDAEQFLLNLLS